MLARLGRALLRKIGTATGLFREDRRRLWRDLLVRIDRYVIYGADVNEVAPPPQSEAMTFRRLSDEEVRHLPSESEAFRAEQRERFERFGFNDAYAVFCDGELSHVSWLITPRHEAASGGRIVRLREGEAEITACFTLAKFRGRGVYGYAIRSLCQVARSRGIHRVFMKTTLQNYASQHGISKAGLLCRGQIIRISFPLFPRVGAAYREHRLPWNTAPGTQAR
jgi:GNAT superfamily N-acetyltransferase